ncbi:MAG: DinB family protein [Candidatus Zixiibacteriota bacterium]
MKLSDFFSNYFTVRTELVKAVQGLTQPQLDWTPANHPASIGRLLAHIADCECFWISCMAMQKEKKPDFTKFEKARTLDEILALLNRYHADFTEYLNAEDVEDWDDTYYQSPMWTEEKFRCSKRWLVWHVVEHQARHRGQIFMLMRMQGIEVPDV